MRESASSGSEDELTGLGNQAAAAAAGLTATQESNTPQSSPTAEEGSPRSSPKYVTATSESETEETEKVKKVRFLTCSPLNQISLSGLFCP